MTLNKLQRFGFRRFINANHGKLERPIPSTDQLENAYASAENLGDGIVRMNASQVSLGTMAYSGIKMLHSFMVPDKSGQPFLVAPIYGEHNHKAGRIIDLFFFGGGFVNDTWKGPVFFDDWFLATGRGALTNVAALDLEYTEENPLMLETSPGLWAESDCRGVIIIKDRARELLTRAAFVRCDSYEAAEELDEYYFQGLPGRSNAVQGPASWDAVQGYIERQARDEAFETASEARRAERSLARASSESVH
jgi:hypothetical protein